jgi:hypothetical protein
MGMKRCGCESYEIITTESCTTESPFFRRRRGHKKIKRTVFIHHQCAVLHFRHLFQSESYRRCDTVLSLSMPSFFSFFLRSSSSCLCLLPLLSVLSTFHSVTCFRRQFLSKKRPIHLVSNVRPITGPEGTEGE